MNCSESQLRELAAQAQAAAQPERHYWLFRLYMNARSQRKGWRDPTPSPWAPELAPSEQGKRILKDAGDAAHYGDYELANQLMDEYETHARELRG